jgi:hypothetical protein
VGLGRFGVSGLGDVQMCCVTSWADSRVFEEEGESGADWTSIVVWSGVVLILGFVVDVFIILVLYLECLNCTRIVLYTR